MTCPDIRPRWRVQTPDASDIVRVQPVGASIASLIPRRTSLAPACDVDRDLDTTEPYGPQPHTSRARAALVSASSPGGTAHLHLECSYLSGAVCGPRGPSPTFQESNVRRHVHLRVRAFCVGLLCTFLSLAWSPQRRGRDFGFALGWLTD
jgi:hypothetical protein